MNRALLILIPILILLLVLLNIKKKREQLEQIIEQQAIGHVSVVIIT